MPHWHQDATHRKPWVEPRVPKYRRGGVRWSWCASRSPTWDRGGHKLSPVSRLLPVLLALPGARSPPPARPDPAIASLGGGVVVMASVPMFLLKRDHDDFLCSLACALEPLAFDSYTRGVIQHVFVKASCNGGIKIGFVVPRVLLQPAAYTVELGTATYELNRGDEFLEAKLADSQWAGKTRLARLQPCDAPLAATGAADTTAIDQGSQVRLGL